MVSSLKIGHCKSFIPKINTWHRITGSSSTESGGDLIKAGKEEELCSRLIIRLHSSLEVTIACLLQLYTSSPFLSDYILSTTNGVKTGPLSFWGHGSVFFQAGQLHRCPPSSTLKCQNTQSKLYTAICSPQGKLSGAINAAISTIKQWLNGFPCGQSGIWTGKLKQAL